MYDEVYTRYEEVFDTRDALLRLITARPAVTPPEDGQVRRVIVTEIAPDYYFYEFWATDCCYLDAIY